ncbi:MAG TPA: hypothetical protein VFP64_01345, partial [Pyrinomonadaceae bacterium]|nr:hypothetical protein [Pyrinomonadaceae bacterium]
MPPRVVNVPGDYFSMAGFEVTLYGRFWVTPEAIARHFGIDLTNTYIGDGMDAVVASRCSECARTTYV